MKIIFRVDDIFLDNNQFEEQLFDIFLKNNIPLTLGVVPMNNKNTPIIYQLNPTTKDQLRSNKFNIAVHGYKHVKNNEYGEFSGVNIEIQNNWIADGIKHLKQLTDFKIDTFIPPWNSFDNNTVSALKNNGIKYLSADNRSYIDSLVVSVPYSVEHLFFLKSKTYKLIQLFSKVGFFKNTVIIVLFHPYNFTEWLNKPYFQNEKLKFNTNFSELNQALVNINKSRVIKAEKLNKLHKIKESKNIFLSLLYRIEARRSLIFFK